MDGISACATKHQLADLHDQAGAFGNRNESARHHQAAPRMVPADQRLGAANLHRARIDHGLIVDLEFIPCDGAAQFILQLIPTSRIGRHVGFKQMKDISAGGLGLIKRKVGAVHELIGLRTVGPRLRNPDAGLDDRFMAVEIIGLADQFDQLAGERDGSVPAIAVRQLQNCELIAADPRHNVICTDRRLQAARHLTDQVITGDMPKRVVDVFEVVEVEQQNIEGRAGHRRLLQRLIDGAPESRSVRQSGQPVMIGLELDFARSRHQLALPNRAERDGEKNADCEHAGDAEIDVCVAVAVLEHRIFGDADNRHQRKPLDRPVGDEAFHAIKALATGFWIGLIPIPPGRGLLDSLKNSSIRKTPSDDIQARMAVGSGRADNAIKSYQRYDAVLAEIDRTRRA